MASHSLEELRRRVGGPFLGDPAVFLALAPLWFLFSLLVVPGISEPPVLLAAGGANLVSLTAYLGLLLVVRATLFRHRATKPVPLTLVLAIGALLGAAKGALTVVLIHSLAPHLNYLEALPDRTLGASTVGIFLLAGSALLLATRDRLRQERDAFLREEARRSNPSPGHNRATANRDSAATEQARTLLEQVRGVLRDTEGQPDRLQEALSDLADLQVRPLSHRIYAASQPSYTDYSVRDLLRILVTQHRYRPLIVVGLYLTTVAIPFTAPHVVPSELAGRTVILAALIGTSLFLLTRLRPTTAFRGAAQLGLAVVACAGLNEVATLAFFGPLGVYSPTVVALTNTLALGLTTVFVGVASISLQDSQAIRENLRETFGEDYWETIVAKQRSTLHDRQLSRFLHGHVIHTLLAARAALGTTPAEEVQRTLNQELDRFATLVGHDLIDETSLEPVALKTLLDDVTRRWAGLIKVTTACSEDLEKVPARTGAVMVQVIDEGIANALRHGHARHARVDLRSKNHHLIVRVVDDGRGLQSGQHGVGSRTLTEIAGERWSRKTHTTEGGTALELVLGPPDCARTSFDKKQSHPQD